MEQIVLLKEQVHRTYVLKTALLRLSRREWAVKGKLNEALGQLYAAKAALQEYETNSLARLLDKYRGRYDEKREALLRDIRGAEAEVNALGNEGISLRQDIDAAGQELAELSGCEEKLAQLADPAEYRRWEARFLCEAALPTLEESYQALLEYRRLIQGNTLQILTVSQQQAIQGSADFWGGQCRELLMPLQDALEALQIPFPVSGYYASPRSYIAYAAADHNRRDRLNRAIDQNLAYQKQMKSILSELED